MNSTEFVKYLSDNELKEYEYRIMGTSTRIIDALVQDFFKKPMGEKIYVYDHYGSREADKMLLKRLINRLEAEHHIVTMNAYVKGCDSHGIYVQRTEPTCHEIIIEEIKRRKENEQWH